MAKKVTTTDEWKDTLGQKIKPGDIIAVATVSGRSPQLVIAQIERINTHNSKGELHVMRTHRGFEEKTHPDGRTYRVPILHEEPTVTVTARPIKDGRDFTRWSNRRYNAATKTWDSTGEIKPVTYSILGNIVRLLDSETLEAAAEKKVS